MYRCVKGVKTCYFQDEKVNTTYLTPLFQETISNIFQPYTVGKANKQVEFRYVGVKIYRKGGRYLIQTCCQVEYYIRYIDNWNIIYINILKDMCDNVYTPRDTSVTTLELSDLYISHVNKEK